MSDVEDLEAALKSHGGADGGSDPLPAGFREKLDGLRAAGAGSDAVLSERRAVLAGTQQLAGQLDSADNLVVKMSKKRAIQAGVNALKLLDSIE